MNFADKDVATYLSTPEEVTKFVLDVQGCIGTCFLWSYVCLRSCLNIATKILIFSHFLGTDIATFTEKAGIVNYKVLIKFCS